MRKNILETVNYTDAVAAILNDHKLISSSCGARNGNIFSIDNFTKIESEIKINIRFY